MAYWKYTCSNKSFRECVRINQNYSSTYKKDIDIKIFSNYIFPLQNYTHINILNRR